MAYTSLDQHEVEPHQMLIPPPPVIPTPTFNPPTLSFADPNIPANVLTVLLGREDPGCTNVARFRTTTNIVLSCLTTIFACTWVALHLDTPSVNKCWWRSFFRRLGWMSLALLAPEFIVGWATDHLLGAKMFKDAWNAKFAPLCRPELVTIPEMTPAQYERELRIKEYKGRWTLTHGFLAKMGGIRVYDSRDKPQMFVLDPSMPEDPKMRPVIQRIGLISKDNISDKSKGDWITKFFVVLQTTWFIVQCLARWATHLPVTELEVVTLAYAVLNIFIYALLWHKPQGLCDPFRVFVEEDGEQESASVEVKGTSEEEEVLKVDIGTDENMPILRYSSSLRTVSEESNELPRPRGSRKPSPPPAKEVEWVRPTTQSGMRGLFIAVTGFGPALFITLSGSIFGALHLLPVWLSIFPSDIERKLWKISAFFVALAPLCTLIVTVPVNLLADATGFTSRANIDIYGYVVSFCTSVPYIVARIVLLVLTFTTLRSLPNEAFRSVEWTRFIPHF